MREDWIEIELGELLKLKNGFAFKAKDYIEEGIPVFRIGDINDWVVSDKNAKKIEEKSLYDDYIVENGDILIAMSGATTGKFGIYLSDKKAYQNQRVGNLKLYSDDLINKSFVFYLLYSLKRKIEEDAYGGAQPNISATKIEALKTNLAPLPIQQAIVSKIETLFSDLDNGIANLKKAQEQLKIYRQAVLKKAFEGELTKEWREKQTNLPAAEELLQQIKEERQNHYNKQLEDWKKAVKEWEKNGKEGKKPGKPKVLKELPPLTEDELKELPKLPKEWNWKKLGGLSIKLSDGPFGSNLKTNDYTDSGVRVIRLENIKNLFFDNSKKSFVTKRKYNSISSHTVYPGDIIFSTFIAEETKVAIIPNYINFAINKADCVCIRPYIIINKKYIEYFLSTRFTYNQLVNQIHGATRPRINTTQLKSVTVALCSIPEQHQIVREIETRLSVCDKVEESITESLEKAKALRQSILKKAFEGKLLTQQEIEQCKQQPDYEPASVLLEKIKAEKLAKEQNQKKSKKKGRK